MPTDIIWKILTVALIGYLMGSFSTSVFFSRLFEKIDIREHGSGNAGTTNTLRVLGKRAALFVLLGDILKCVVAVCAGAIIFGQYGRWIGGIACTLGHMYPVFFGFRGGKGVATGFSMMVLADPRAGLLAVAIFFIVCIPTRIVSLSSMLAFASFPVFVAIFGGGPVLTLIAAAVAIFVIYKHKENIARIASGNEKKITFNRSGG